MLLRRPQKNEGFSRGEEYGFLTSKNFFFLHNKKQVNMINGVFLLLMFLMCKNGCF